MNKKQFDNSNFVLYSPDSLNYINKSLESILSASLELYKKVFDIDNFRKIQINYFDKIEDFRHFIYELRGEEESLPDYAKGTFDKGMINSFIENNLQEGSVQFNKRQYMASHELFHIMYKELVWQKNNQQRVVWFDEGMAEFLSGEFNREMTTDFEDWFDSVKESTIVIPNLNTLSHKEGFQTDNYNGYDLSLLAVKYLYDNLGLEGLKTLLKENDSILKYGPIIISDAFNYYEKKSIKTK